MEAAPTQFAPDLGHRARSHLSRDLDRVSNELSDGSADVERRLVRDELLHLAAKAVEEHDNQKLAGALSLLGQLAIEEQGFDAAEVYFLEALEVYRLLDDSVGAAEVHLHLGRMHLKLRQRAKIAGHAYDRLLLARWQLSDGQYDVAEENLHLAVEENLSINRFGAAASAYQSLMRLYAENGLSWEFETTVTQAARLYAASGQMNDARAMLTRLRGVGIEAQRLGEIARKVAADFAEYTANVEQVAAARDYGRLYNHYRSQGQDERAWSLRLKANESLRDVPKRAMYGRTPDALAVLYASLQDVERANVYFNRAREVFDALGRSDLVSRAQQMSDQLQ